MIEPEVFYSNEQTLESNHYQYKHDKELEKVDIKEKALIEFKGLKSKIEASGITVTSMKGIEDCPDHIFPNWFITFENKFFTEQNKSHKIIMNFNKSKVSTLLRTLKAISVDNAPGAFIPNLAVFEVIPPIFNLLFVLSQ